MHKRLFIGVDPAFRKNGFAAAIIDGDTLQTKRFVDLIDFVFFVVSLHNMNADVVFCIENANEQNVTFSRAWAQSAAKHARLSRNVGANQAVSELACSAIKRLFGESRLISVSPKEKGQKISKEYLNSILKSMNIKLCKSRSLSQDEIDAAKLAIFAKNRIWSQKS
jgi:hypothetical protein